MTKLSSGQSASLILEVGDSYTIGTTGSATVKGIYGAPSVTTPLNSNFQVFGPYGAPAKLDIQCISGSTSYDLVGPGTPVTSITDPLTGGNNLIAGTSTLKLPAGEVDLTGGVGSGSQLDQFVASVYAYEPDGSVVKRLMPRNEYLQQLGANLFQPTALTGTAARTVVMHAGGAFVGASNAGTDGAGLANIAQIDFLGGWNSTTWTGLNIPMPSDKRLQFMLWSNVHDTESPNAYAGGITLKITNASGTFGWTYVSACFKKGWNTITLWDPASTSDLSLAQTGVSFVAAGNTLTNWTQPITSISIEWNGAPAGSQAMFAGVWSYTKLKPMVCMTFDTSNANVFTNFVPVWSAAGLSAGLRAGGDSYYRNDVTFRNGLAAAQALGFDVVNGSWSRATLTDATPASTLAYETGMQQNWNVSQGLRGGVLFSSKANQLASNKTCREVFPKFGVKLAKVGTAKNRVTPLGPFGLDDPYQIKALGFPSKTVALQQLASLVDTGGILLWFAHECPIGAGSYSDSVQSNASGGSMWAEDAAYFATYLKDLQDQGLIQVVSPAQLIDILEGNA